MSKTPPQPLGCCACCVSQGEIGVHRCGIGRQNITRDKSDTNKVKKNKDSLTKTRMPKK